jgi:hypothetical protein
MRFVAIKHLRDGFSLFRCERRNIDERLNTLFSYPRNDGASVRVTAENNWPIRAFDNASQRRNVIGKRSQRNLSADHPESLSFDGENHVPPAGTVRPRPVHENDSRIVRESIHCHAALCLSLRAIPLVSKNSLIAEAISTACVSSAKWPVSRN